ncbi:hypothetical protein V8G54_036369 [Vigna mungo]|uniref:Retrovirus-related Pol polyprotein from transposon RE2 n=1 Tax=Vigna mungo TaxID=3915 RepID=A0AAQ3MGY7_VIGMU
MANTKSASTPLSATAQLLKDSVSRTRGKSSILKSYSLGHRLQHQQTCVVHATPHNDALVCPQTGIFISATAPLTFHAYSNADWAGDKDDYISTTGYLLYIGSTPISWSSRKKRFVARSSTEVEYKALADTASELLWVLSLFTKLGHMPTTNPIIYCDNLGATTLTVNLVFHTQMKHIALAYHFVRENVQKGKFLVSFVSTDDQLADILTKSLLHPWFDLLLSKLHPSSRSSNLREDINYNN